MDNHELQEFDLDDILNEFHEDPPEAPSAEETALPADQIAPTEEILPLSASETSPIDIDPLGDLDKLLADTPESESLQEELHALEALLEEPAAGEAPSAGDAPSTEETVRFDPVTEEKAGGASEPDPAVLEEDTIRMEDLPELAEEVPAEEAPLPPPIEFNPRARLRELKKKLVAGPERRYYELTELGVGKLQMAILVNIILVILCALTTSLFTMGLVPENRLRFVIFSQVLAMLISALLGSNLMIDSLADLFRGRFSVNTLLTITFAACCVDAVMCLIELRIPCCAAFSLEMTMALWARYERRSTEMAQMDTMRKAIKLNRLVKVDGYCDGKPGILRTMGEVEDFMDTYHVPSAPEKLQGFYAFVAMLACFGIAAFAGMRHGTSLAVQILSTSLLVAVPASSFIAATRPMAVLERRLHMVGTVLCGWQGVKKLSGKAAFPLSDEDLFPKGSTKLNGVKFYGDRTPDEVVSFSASLIEAAGGGLVPLFQQLVQSRGCAVHPVVNFRDYGGGGIGGEVLDEPVLLGSLNFLQDMGVEIPEGTMVNQAVYAAIDGQLCAVYAISYAKMRSSSAGLISLCSSRNLNPVMVGGDFMLTDSLIHGKFGVNTRRMRFPSREERKAMNAIQATSENTALALTTRDDLVCAAYAVSGARSLRTATNLGVAVHILGGLLGIAIMLVLAYLGSTELLTPTNVLLYQLVWLVPGLLITEWTRTV